MEELKEVTAVQPLSYRIELSCLYCRVRLRSGEIRHVVFEDCRKLAVDWSSQVEIDHLDHGYKAPWQTLTAVGGEFSVTYQRAYVIRRKDIPDIIREFRKFC